MLKIHLHFKVFVPSCFDQYGPSTVCADPEILNITIMEFCTTERQEIESKTETQHKARYVYISQARHRQGKTVS